MKLLLKGSASLIARELTGTAVAKWLDVGIHIAQPLALVRFRWAVPRAIPLDRAGVRVPLLKAKAGASAPQLVAYERLAESKVRDLLLDLLGKTVGGGFAVLARLRDDREAVHRIVERVAGLAVAELETALAQLMILPD